MKMIAALFVSSLLAATLAAEDVWPGARVRVITSGHPWVIGTVVESDAEGLTLRTGKGEPRRVRLSDVSRLDVSRSRSRKGRGVFAGAAIGAFGGFILGAATNSDGCQPSESNSCWLFGTEPLFSDAESGLMVGALLSGVGALVGGIVAPGEKWAQVASPNVRLSVAPVPRGAAVALTLRF